jgi:Mn2+/Fe2+ NRAMP family transporter
MNTTPTRQSYRHLRALEWLALALLAYAAAALMLKLPWLRLLYEELPKLSWQTVYITAVVAIFGTTVSHHLFFWQHASEAPDLR